jgi:hypothetical protein
MKSLSAIEKRLAEAEKNRPRPIAYRLHYASRANSTAFMLTGMLGDDPNTIELHWSNESRTRTDTEKLRWLGQYTHEQIEKIRVNWTNSSSARDKAALQELDRLIESAEGFDAIRQAFLRRGNADK